MRILGLILGRTGTYDSMYQRPYQMGTNDVNALLQVAESTRYGSAFTENNLAAFAGGILKPKAQHEGEASIANGWGTERLQFVLKIDVSPMDDASLIELVTGYTDHYGVSNLTGLNAVFDPQMRFHVNSTLQFRRQWRNVNGIQQSMMTMVDSSQLVAGEYNPTLANIGGGQLTCRPEDIFATMQVNMADWNGARPINTGVAFVEPLKKSRLANTHAPSYLTSLLKSYDDALKRSDHQSSMTDVLDYARDLSQDGTISNDHFLNLVRQMSGDRHRSFITWSELMRMDSTLNDRAQLVTTGNNVRRDDRYYAGQGQVWSGADPLTHAANIIANSLSCLLMACGLSAASFTATNMVAGSSMHGIGGLHGEFMDGFTFIPMNGRSLMEGADASPLIMSVLRPRLIRETLLPLTDYGNMPLNISVEADVTSEIRINISMADGIVTPYCMPAFAGALFSPIVTSDVMLPGTIGSCVDNLLTEIKSLGQPAGFATGV